MTDQPPTDPAEPSSESGSNTFKHVETLVDPDGVIAVITERERDGRVSFSINREYEVNGKTRRTAYLSKRHIPAIRRLLNDLIDHLEAAEDRGRAKHR